MQNTLIKQLVEEHASERSEAIQRAQAAQRALLAAETALKEAYAKLSGVATSRLTWLGSASVRSTDLPALTCSIDGKDAEDIRALVSRAQAAAAAYVAAVDSLAAVMPKTET